MLKKQIGMEGAMQTVQLGVVIIEKIERQPSRAGASG